jgi:hypothetical protein
MGAEGEPSRPDSALIPTSPRSVEACFRLGLDPLDLVYRPLAAFKRPGEPAELTEKRHAHHEALRQVGWVWVGLGRACEPDWCPSVCLSVCLCMAWLQSSA